MDSRPHEPTEPPEEPLDGAAAEPADGADEPDVERRWAEIVAHLDDLRPPADDGTAPAGGGTRAQGGSPTEDGARDNRSGQDVRRFRREPGAAPEDVAPGPSRGAPGDPRSWGPDPVVEEAEDHFEPPDPGPVLGGDPLLTMAWSAVVAVPVLLLVAALVWRDVPTLVLQVAGIAFLLGAGLLVWRMPRGDEHDGGGPGAVV